MCGLLRTAARGGSRWRVPRGFEMARGTSQAPCVEWVPLLTFEPLAAHG